MASFPCWPDLAQQVHGHEGYNDFGLTPCFVQEFALDLESNPQAYS
jgi:hypothetical protein